MKYHKNYNWVVLRLLVGCIILIAAGLKAEALAAGTPDFGSGLLHARWFNIIVVECELVFGVWLLSGLLQKLVWLTAIVCFVIFSLTAWFKFFIGERSCGCWGNVDILPIYTAVFDTMVIGLLIAFRPKEIIFHWQTFFQELVGLRFSKRFFAALGIWFVVAVPVTYAMTSVKFVTLATDSVVTGNEKSIILQPSQWIDKNFPLLQFLDDANVSKISTGRKNVVLFRFDCEECRQMIEKIQNKNHYIFIAIPSEKNNVALFSLSEYSTLPERYEWWIETPVVFVLENGTVKEVLKEIE
ncbi:MAG: hypothetical protein LBJ67_06310 [Planctomycetaceae bacterium]|nr:hypothetical protein [Planctomycetaceae bacterium]